MGWGIAIPGVALSVWWVRRGQHAYLRLRPTLSEFNGEIRPRDVERLARRYWDIPADDDSSDVHLMWKELREVRTILGARGFAYVIAQAEWEGRICSDENKPCIKCKQAVGERDAEGVCFECWADNGRLPDQVRRLRPRRAKKAAAAPRRIGFGYGDRTDWMS